MKVMLVFVPGSNVADRPVGAMISSFTFFGPIWLLVVLWGIITRGYHCQVCGAGRYW